jgi:thiosulfate/3-mercaptopyruvate sulfurtransferase
MVDEIKADELKRRLDTGERPQIVDIRQPGEFETGHIEGAENIPFHRFAREVERHEWRDEIVVVCPLGESSLQAARLLEAYEDVDEDAWVANLADGYQSWEYGLETGPSASAKE